MISEDNIVIRKKYLVASKSKLDSIIESINTKYNFSVGNSTETYGVPVKHPTEDKWMLVIDEQFYTDFTESDLEEYGVTELSGDWT